MTKRSVTALLSGLLLLLALFPAQGSAEEGDLIEDPALAAAIRKQEKLSIYQPLDMVQLEQLRELTVPEGSGVKSLKGLEWAYDLNKLSLRGQALTNIAPLSNLNQLIQLDVSDNQLTSVCSLSGLSELQELRAAGNRITDIGCLSRMKSLVELNVDDNQIEDISALTKLWLTTLSLKHNEIHDLSPAARFPQLQELHTEDNPLDEASALLVQRLDQSGVDIDREPGEDEEIVRTVRIKRERVLFDQAPFLEQSSTMVQFRPLFEQLGFAVRWDGEQRKIYAEKQGVRLELQVDQPTAKLNGHDIPLAVAPRNVQGSIFVPLRFVGEASGYGVAWDRITKTVYLSADYPVKGRSGHFEMQADGHWIPSIFTLDYLDLILVSDSDYIFVNDYVGKPGLFDEMVQNLRKRFKDDEAFVKENDALNVQGMKGYQVVFEADTDILNGYTLLDGGSHIYALNFSGYMDDLDNGVLQQYEKMVQSFRVIPTAEEAVAEHFGKLKPEERLLDAARYYRQLGFFAADKALTEEQFDRKFKQIYADQYDVEEGDWNPFSPENSYGSSAFADLYVLAEDKDRVWLEDTEADVMNGNEVYAELLQRWSDMSRGAFKPTDIQETWESDEGPAKVTFMLDGKKRTIYPQYMNDFIDTGIVEDLNAMIADSGYQFAAVEIDQQVFVTVLTAEEKAAIERDRFLPFVEEEQRQFPPPIRSAW